MAEAVVEEYTTSLEDLTFNSKPHINALTMLAEEYLPHADLIVRVIEAKLNKAHASGKLPLMYLMDSIVKNVGGNYTPLFAKNIVKSFHSTFAAGDEKIKMSLYKLRSTWDNYFPLKKLYELDVNVHGADPNWPVKPLPASLQDKPSTSIHVNPKFLKKAEPAPAVQSVPAAAKTPVSGASDSVDLKQDLINKQKQLLELQQQKLLLELEQTRQQLALREKRNSQGKKAEPTPSDPRVKPVDSAAKAPSLRVTLTNGQKPTSAQLQKDPRTQTADKAKQNVYADVKKTPATSELRPKSQTQKKAPSEPDKPKAVVKKSPGETKKKKASPNNPAKTSKGVETPSPKTLTKLATGKKTKANAKKKSESKSVKKVASQKEDVPKTEKAEVKEQPKVAVKREALKKRDRPLRRSPPRNQAPPAKQPRRSASIERRRSPPLPRRNPEHQRSNVPRQRPVALREDELRRESPMSNEGSMSPRFSPEPDEGSPAGRGQSWRPPVKRARQHEPTGPWRQEERMPARNIPQAMRRSSVDTSLRIPQELTLSHQAEILKQAEIQLQTGQLTHSQHQDLLKQLHLLFELQRLRNLQQRDGPLLPDHDGPRMPLDELLPEHDSSEFQHNLMQRQDENRPPPFRPPPSPPPMDREARHPHAQRLTPPPVTISDPRQKRLQPGPRREDPRFREHGDFPRRPPDFRDEREALRPRRNVEGRPPLLDRLPSPDRLLRGDRRPSPDRRRGNGSWKNPPRPQRTEFGEDLGSVFVLDEDEEYKPRRDQHENYDLQNGAKPAPEGVPLREYAHPELKHHAKIGDTAKRRRSVEDRGLLRHPRQTASRKSPHEIDTEDGGFSESGDYPPGKIAPEEEAYHEHSMKLKRGQSEAERAYREHKKNILVSKYTKKLAAEGLAEKKDEDDLGEKSSIATELLAESVSSPDSSKRDRLEEEVNKSPSLPLKKRKYMISSSSDVRDSSDGGNLTETEVELLEASKDDVLDAKEEEQEEDFRYSPDTKKGDLEEDEEVDKYGKKISQDEGKVDEHEGKISEGGKKVDENEEKVLRDEEDDKVDEEVVGIKREKGIQEEKVIDGQNEDYTVDEPASDRDREEDKLPNVKKEKPDEDEEESPFPEDGVVNKNMDEESETKADDEISEEPSTSGVKEEVSEDVHLVENKKKKGNGSDERILRIQQLAMADANEDAAHPGGKNKEKGRKGQPLPRGTRMEDEKYAELEEERLRDLMREEEERLRWEAELEMQLGREEFEEMQQRENRGKRLSPPPRRWGRGEEGPWRGPRGHPRRGWGRDEEFWDEERRFAGRPRPGRMPPRRRGEPMDNRDWDRRWDDRRPGPMRPRHPDDRMLPRHPDRIDGARVPPQSPPRPFTPTGAQPQGEMSQVNVNKLLSDLLTMGIIPGPVKKVAEGERMTSAPQSPQPSNSAESNVAKTERSQTPEPSQKDVPNLAKPVRMLENNRVPTPVFEDILTMDPDANLPNVKLNDGDKLKIRHEELIKRLYTGIQCSACGMRFTACQTDMYAEHLDWHYRLNRKDRDGGRETHRMLYPTAGEWIMHEEIVDPSQRAKNEVFDDGEMEEENNQIEAAKEHQDSEDLVVPVARNPEQDKCAVCNEAFKTVYNDEEEEWQYVNCVAVEDKNFHPSCYADYNDNPEPGPLPTPVRVPLYNPIELSLKGIPGLDSLREEAGTEQENEQNGSGSAEVTAETERDGTDETTATNMEAGEPVGPTTSDPDEEKAEGVTNEETPEVSPSFQEKPENLLTKSEDGKNEQKLSTEDDTVAQASPKEGQEREDEQKSSEMQDESSKEMGNEGTDASAEPSTSGNQDSEDQEHPDPAIQVKLEDVNAPNPSSSDHPPDETLEVSARNDLETTAADPQNDSKDDIKEASFNETEPVLDTNATTPLVIKNETPVPELDPLGNATSSNLDQIGGDQPPPPRTEIFTDSVTEDKAFGSLESDSDDENVLVTL